MSIATELSHTTTANANVISGKDFKLHFPDTTFCLVNNLDVSYRGSHYHTGVNKSPTPFKYAFEFIDIHQLYLWLDRRISIRLVEIMDDSLIDVSGESFKANMCILGEKQLISELPLWHNLEWCNTVVRYYGTCSSMNMASWSQTEDLCLAAVRKSSRALLFIKNPSKAVCLEALRQNYRALQYITEPTEEMCLEAIRQNGLALQYITEPTDEMCLAAVQQTGDALQFVIHKTREIGLAALSQYGIGIDV